MRRPGSIVLILLVIQDHKCADFLVGLSPEQQQASLVEIHHIIILLCEALVKGPMQINPRQGADIQPQAHLALSSELWSRAVVHSLQTAYTVHRG